MNLLTGLITAIGAVALGIGAVEFFMDHRDNRAQLWLMISATAFGAAILLGAQ